MPTVASSGACMTNSARRSSLTRSVWLWVVRSSKNCCLMRNGRPASLTSASPAASISSRAPSNRWATWPGSAGAPMVATARSSGTRAAAVSTAAPPRLWPINRVGAAKRPRRASAAATRSSTLELKLVLANSPSLWPGPVKSKRRTAMSRSASSRAMRLAAKMSLPQVKQWANRAKARGGASGRSSRAASSSPKAPVNVSFSLRMVPSPSPSRRETVQSPRVMRYHISDSPEPMRDAHVQPRQPQNRDRRAGDRL